VSVLNPEQAELLRKQRVIAHRALGQGRRWYLRAVLMMVIASAAGWRGGQINYTVAIVMVILSGIAASMGRSMRRSARESLQKIALMERQAPGPANAP